MEHTFYEAPLPQVDLIHASRTVGLPFDASPLGRWVRFELEGNPIYLVSDAWGTGFGLLSLEAGGAKEVQHFLSAKAAVAAVVLMAGPVQSAELVDIGLPAA